MANSTERTSSFTSTVKSLKKFNIAIKAIVSISLFIVGFKLSLCSPLIAGLFVFHRIWKYSPNNRYYPLFLSLGICVFIASVLVDVGTMALILASFKILPIIAVSLMVYAVVLAIYDFCYNRIQEKAAALEAEAAPTAEAPAARLEAEPAELFARRAPQADSTQRLRLAPQVDSTQRLRVAQEVLSGRVLLSSPMSIVRLILSPILPEGIIAIWASPLRRAVAAVAEAPAARLEATTAAKESDAELLEHAMGVTDQVEAISPVRHPESGGSLGSPINLLSPTPISGDEEEEGDASEPEYILRQRRLEVGPNISTYTPVSSLKIGPGLNNAKFTLSNIEGLTDGNKELAEENKKEVEAKIKNAIKSTIKALEGNEEPKSPVVSSAWSYFRAFGNEMASMMDELTNGEKPGSEALKKN